MSHVDFEHVSGSLRTSLRFGSNMSHQPHVAFSTVLDGDLQYSEEGSSLINRLQPVDGCRRPSSNRSPSKMGRTRRKVPGGIADVIGERWSITRSCNGPETAEIIILRLTCMSGTTACSEKSTTPAVSQVVTTSDISGMC